MSKKGAHIVVHFKHKRRDFIRRKDNAIDADHVVANFKIIARNKD